MVVHKPCFRVLGMRVYECVDACARAQAHVHVMCVPRRAGTGTKVLPSLPTKFRSSQRLFCLFVYKKVGASGFR